MSNFFRAPLLKSLIFVNAVAVIILALPFFWPLPSAKIEHRSQDLNVLEQFLGTATSFDTSPAREKPIFHENRRSIAKAAQAPTVQAPTREKVFEFQLVGIMGSTDGRRTAYIQNIQSGETLSVQESNIVMDWTISAIEAERLIVTSGANRKIIALPGGG